MKVRLCLLVTVALAALGAGACGKRTAEPPPARLHCTADEAPPPDPLPAYLASFATRDLYVRHGDAIVSAPENEVRVLRGYPAARARGALHDGRRVTLLTPTPSVAVGDPVRVIHVLEVERAGEELWVMGPKPIVGEHVDDKLVGEPVPAWGPFTTGVYDGAVLQSPGVDTNFEITTYTFDAPGVHRIQWRAGAYHSNVLCIEVR